MEEQTPQSPPPIQPVQPVPVAPEKKSGLPRIVILLIVTLLIAGAVYGGVQIGRRQADNRLVSKITPTLVPQPTEVPDATADWKTYRSVQYGFEFKYPVDWVFQPDKQTPEEILSFVKDLNSLTVYLGSASTGIPSGRVPNKVRSVLLGNIEAKKETYEGLFELISFPENLEMNYIVLRYRDGILTEEYSKVFDQILSTFRFTD